MSVALRLSTLAVVCLASLTALAAEEQKRAYASARTAGSMAVGFTLGWPTIVDGTYVIDENHG